MSNPKNKLLQIIPIDANANHFQLNCKNISVLENAIRRRNNFFNF